MEEIRKPSAPRLINFGGNFGFALGSLLVILILEKIGIQYTPIAMAGGLIAAWVLIRKLPSDQHIPVAEDHNRPRQKLGAAKIFLLASLVFTVYSLYILWVSLFNYMPIYYSPGRIKPYSHRHNAVSVWSPGRGGRVSNRPP
ncbi:MAG: hypothetical protein U5N58_02930 [Actinomycetota bacterium]|nr:hypothetical protein [Actinomycetota bacterium]